MHPVIPEGRDVRPVALGFVRHEVVPGHVHLDLAARAAA